MDPIMWAVIAGGAVVLIALGAWFLPARTTILVDTATSTARADLGLLWGIGPRVAARAAPKEAAGNPLAVFNDPEQIGHALMTPGIADTAYTAVAALFACNPRVAEVKLGLNLADPSRDRVVQTAVHAPLASAPAPLRQAVQISKCEAPGAELSANFQLAASPAHLSGIYGRFKDSRAAREFRRRLKQKPKQSKKAPREIQAS